VSIGRILGKGKVLFSFLMNDVCYFCDSQLGLSFLDSSSLGGNPGKMAKIVIIRREKASIARKTILVVNWKSRKKILMLTKLILAGFFPARLRITNILLHDTAKDLFLIKTILVPVIWCTGAQAAPRIN